MTLLGQIQNTPNSLRFVDPTSPTKEAEGVGSSEGVQNLTAEGLLLYCQAQLNNLDREIHVLLSAQQGDVDQKDVLSKLQGTLNGYAPPASEKDINECEAAYNKAIDALPDGEIRNDLIKQRDKAIGELKELAAKARADLEEKEGRPVNPSEVKVEVNSMTWEATTGEVGRLGERISGDAELRMIKLQSFVSKRQSAIQLTTNLMSKFNQGLDSVVKNM